MNEEILDDESDYDPNPLLDLLINKLNLKNDAALCRVLGVSPPVISKIRHRVLRIGSSMLIRMHEESGMNIRELRALMGDRRTKTRVSNIYRQDAERQSANKQLAAS